MNALRAAAHESPRRFQRFLTVLSALTLAGAPCTYANIYSVTGTADGPGILTPTGSGTFNASTLRTAVDAANATSGAHTILVPPGIYSLTFGELQVGTNANSSCSIIGAGPPDATVIQHDLSTAAARVFDFDPLLLGGVTVTLQNLTIAHGRNNDGFGGAGLICGFQGGAAPDSTSISNCVFIDNLVIGGASGAVGGAIQNIGGNLFVSSCRFETNSAGNFSGGAIYYDSHSPSIGAFQVSNSQFINNTAADLANGGGAIFAAAVLGSSPFDISGCTFTGNQVTSATGNGGAIIKFGTASLLINSCTFISNQVLGVSAPSNTAMGGAIDNGGGPMTIQFCRFFGNSTATAKHGNAVNNNISAATLSAGNNWWGTNTGPGLDLSGASVTAWLQLSHYATPASINLSNSTILTASFRTNSAGSPVAVSNLTVLIGLPVSFSNALKGTLSSMQSSIQASAAATATFTALDIPGAARADAQVDNAIATAPINIICPVYTGVLSGGATICAGASAQVTVTINTSFGPYAVTLDNAGGSKTNFSPLVFDVAPGATTTYSVLSAIDSNNCPVNVSGSALITINPSPSAEIIGTPENLCANAVSNQASGPPGLAGYSWSISNGTIISGSQAQIVTFNAGVSGNLLLGLTVSNASGCSASNGIAIPITPVSTPVIALSPSAIFPGAPGNQASALGGYDNYSWKISNGMITGPTNLPVINYVGGFSGPVLLQLSVSTSNGCSAVSWTNVPILPAPVTPAGCSIRTNYFAGTTLIDALAGTTMTMAFDGTNYWSCSGGGTSGNRLARYDTNGILLGTFAPGLDFRSVFTDGSRSVLARAYNDTTIYRQTAPGVFAPSGVSLSGGLLDPQAAVVLNGRGTEYIALSNGVVSRWDTGGHWLGLVPLQTFGSVAGENSYPQNRGIAAVGDLWLTYNGAGILSVWDTFGNRLMQSTLSAAGGGFDSSYSFSYGNGRVFIVDVAAGTWRGYEVCNIGRVAVVGTPANTNWNADVQAKILGTGFFPQVDVFYANPSVPTLGTLRQYQAVLVYSDAYFGDPVSLGNGLADYVDLGGGVSVATFAFWNSGGLAMQGRLLTGGYLPFTTGQQLSGTALTLVKDLPLHPLLTDVISFNGGSSSFHNNPIATAAGAVLVAHWSNGQPLIGAKEFALGRVAGLNFYPPSSSIFAGFWQDTTDGAKLMANALLWSGKLPPWILAGPVSQPALPGGNINLNVAAKGVPPLYYQWFRDGQPLPGATNNFLGMDVQPNSSGTYRAMVFNPYGAAFSSTASVYPPLRFLPLTNPAGSNLSMFLGNADGTPLITDRVQRIQVFSAETLAVPFTNWFEVPGPLLLTNGLLRVDHSIDSSPGFFRATEWLP